MVSDNALLVIIGVIFVVVILYHKVVSKKEVEHYKDYIWMDKPKLQYDYYSRSNGSIYGFPGNEWDMFKGYPTYPRAQ